MTNRFYIAKKQIKLRPAQQIALSFLFVILVGTVLLSMPFIGNFLAGSLIYRDFSGLCDRIDTIGGGGHLYDLWADGDSFVDANRWFGINDTDSDFSFGDWW
jgi:hypothetical protein